jgi:hypothetical protein
MQLLVPRARIQNSTGKFFLSLDNTRMSLSDASFGIGVGGAGLSLCVGGTSLCIGFNAGVCLAQLSDGIIDKFQQALVIFMSPLQQEPQPLDFAIAVVSHGDGSH